MNLNDRRANAYSASGNSGKAGKSDFREEKNSERREVSDGKESFHGRGNSSGRVFSDGNIGVFSDGALLKVPAEEKAGKDSAYRRVAKFLMILGVDEAAKVLQHLSSEQVEKIVPHLASIRSLGPEEREVILAEFEGLLDRTAHLGGKQTAFTILEKVYGADRAEEMISKAAPYTGKKPFDYLSDAGVEKLEVLLSDESAGIQALVLSHLEPKKAAAVINRMEGEAKKDVARHLANLGSVNPDFLGRVDQAMHEKSLSIQTEEGRGIDGRSSLSEILKRMSPDAGKSILETLSEDDPDLGRELKKRLFTIDDVLNADDRFVQEYLREMSDIEVARLVAGKTPDFREKVLGCVSKGRRSLVLEEEDAGKPFLARDCDEETSRFVSAMRSAYEKGSLVIRGRNDGDYV